LAKKVGDIREDVKKFSPSVGVFGQNGERTCILGENMIEYLAEKRRPMISCKEGVLDVG
jgi:hypothetical protein